MMSSDGFEVWVGLVEVRPLPGNVRLEGDPGAFANAVTVAADVDDFCARAASFFRGEGFEVVSFESVERLTDRGVGSALPEEMRRLGEAAAESSQVQFDRYFAYGSSDE
jgi:hypothetical protein